MPRDVIAEWLRALICREPVYVALARTEAFDVRRRAAPECEMPGRSDVRATRPLPPGRAPACDRGDLTQAIHVMQRHNRRLRETFGVEWADATSVVLGEAQRRGARATMLARALAVRLRTEQA